MSENQEIQMPQGEYDYFFSMGGSCPTAMILKTRGLRSFSGPFDWIGGFTFEERLDFLLSDTQLVLDTDEWEYQGNRFEPEARDIYVNKRLNMLYPHDFPYNTPLEISAPIIKDRYERRLKRLRDILRQDKTILFAYMAEEKDKDFDLDRMAKNCVRFNESIKAKANMIYIQNDASVPKGEFRITRPNDCLTFVECAYVLDGVKVDMELVEKLFMGYHCTGEAANKKWMVRQKLKKKIKSWFINKRVKGDDFYYRILGFKYRPKRPKIK